MGALRHECQRREGRVVEGPNALTLNQKIFVMQILIVHG